MVCELDGVSNKERKDAAEFTHRGGQVVVGLERSLEDGAGEKTQSCKSGSKAGSAVWMGEESQGTNLVS